jgi:hypothetical protein
VKLANPQEISRGDANFLFRFFRDDFRLFGYDI